MAEYEVQIGSVVESKKPPILGLRLTVKFEQFN
jgi:hypothetical protein